MRRRLSLGRLAVAASVLTACDTGREAGDATPSPAVTSAAAASAQPAPISSPAATASAVRSEPPPVVRVLPSTESFVQFVSPSGNIGCELSSDGAACELRLADWDAPPRPADCDADWNGRSVSVAGSSVQVGACVTDTVFDGGAEVLRYGTGWRLGDATCSSAASGITCTHVPSGRGFTVSRASLALR